MAKRLVWRGELASARELLRSLQALADDRGDLTSYAMIRMHMVEVELRAGNLAAAASLLDEWGESSDYETQFRPQYPRCRALLEVQRGAGEEAQRWADETIRLAQAAGSMWDELEARRAPGDQRPARSRARPGRYGSVGRVGALRAGGSARPGRLPGGAGFSLRR